MSATVDALVREAPAFHGQGQRSWAVAPALLGWLAEHAPDGGASLETGSGASTAVLLERSARHTVVTPAADEVERVLAWCRVHGVRVDALDLQLGGSQAVLPRLVDGGPLDLVLVDGDHAFPAPMLDWYYTADRVREGGHVVVDDVQLRPPRLLRDFLRAEPGWQELPPVGRAAVFRRTGSGPATGRGWQDQPWSAVGPYLVGDEPLALRLQVLRVHLRLRSRLREVPAVLARARHARSPGSSGSSRSSRQERR